MRVLILGGTNFLGPHIVRKLQTQGHELTLFNRGKTPDSFEGVTRLRGDRLLGDLEALRGKSFDATIDVCAYVPRAVDAVLDALDDPGFYCFVSTVSVYASFSEKGQTEQASLATLEDETTEEITGETYGGLKVLCEKAVRQRTGTHAILRPGLVIGPGDPTDRWSYWPVRVSQGGAMLVPESPDEPLQWIDVRDLADFTCRVVEEKVEGTFNLVTPPLAHSMGSLLEACEEVTGVQPSYVWMNEEERKRFELQPWADFPAWIPSTGESGGMTQTDSTAAMLAGLKTRSARESVQDFLEWWNARLEDKRRLQRGLSPEKEKEILEEWGEVGL